MGKQRQRFTPDERASFTTGTRVEWQNVTQWHPAIVTGAIKIDDIGGGHYVEVVNKGRSRSLSPGEVIRATPGHIRLPATTPPQCPARYVGPVSGGRRCHRPEGHAERLHATTDGHAWTDEQAEAWHRNGLTTD